MEDPALPGREQVEALLRARMPFGKYRGRRLFDLPDAYLVWFSRQGFPGGQLGRQLEQVFELNRNGLLGALRHAYSAGGGGP